MVAGDSSSWQAFGHGNHIGWRRCHSFTASRNWVTKARLGFLPWFAAGERMYRAARLKRSSSLLLMHRSLVRDSRSNHSSRRGRTLLHHRFQQLARIPGKCRRLSPKTQERYSPFRRRDAFQRLSHRGRGRLGQSLASCLRRSCFAVLQPVVSLRRRLCCQPRLQCTVFHASVAGSELPQSHRSARRARGRGDHLRRLHRAQRRHSSPTRPGWQTRNRAQWLAGPLRRRCCAADSRSSRTNTGNRAERSGRESAYPNRRSPARWPDPGLCRYRPGQRHRPRDPHAKSIGDRPGGGRQSGWNRQPNREPR